MKIPKFIYFFILCVALSATLSAQIVINEFSAANASRLPDEFGKYGDWIEFYNAGNSAVNLFKFKLSDDPLVPAKWQFPSVTISAQGYLTVFADDNSKLTFLDHWETPVNANDNWAYCVPNPTTDTNWRNLTFNDASWLKGKGGFGFGDGDDSTVLSNSTSVYLRKKFNISDTAEIMKAMFHIDYDDGFVAYLNGIEIARKNIGIVGTRPLFSDFADSEHEARMFQGFAPDSFSLDYELLKRTIKNGNNVLAVEVHNLNSFSSDLSAIPYFSIGLTRSTAVFPPPPAWFNAPLREYLHANFKLSKEGEVLVLSDSSGIILDQKFTGAMQVDVSLGRLPDGATTWCNFSPSSPCTSNNNSICYSGVSGSVLFSLAAGNYAASQMLSLSAVPPSSTIRYTTDGSIPTDTSFIYVSALQLDTTQTIRARVFTPGLIPGNVGSSSYFINENLHLPVFSLTTNPANLWDDSTGIYVLGNHASTTYPFKGANYWMDWEKPVSVEYFDKQKNRVLQFDAGFKINGNYSRTKPQKSFEVALDNDYGVPEITYPLIPEKENIKTYDSFILRNAGTDWNVVHYRDGLMQRIMRNTHTGYLGYEPCNLFLNGAYWGVYEIRTNDNHTYVERNFGLDKSEFDLLFEGGDLEVKNGSDTGFFNMYNYAMAANVVDTAFYKVMNSKIDLKNYADYFIAETYFVNNDWIGDWTNNVKLWRPKAAGGKWQYILYDLDFGMGLYSSHTYDKLAELIDPEDENYQTDIFNKMIANPLFRNDFINRYADLINTIYAPVNVRRIAYQMRDSIAQDMPLQFARWGSSMGNWAQNISTLINFANRRPARALNYVQANFGLNAQVLLTLDVYPQGAGRIQISTVIPDSLPWKGTYFNGNPVTITAIPNPGYQFDHWNPSNCIATADSNQSIRLNFTSNDSVVAYFVGSAAQPHITFSEINYNSAGTADAGDWVEFHNLDSIAYDVSGWKFKDNDELHVFTFPVGTRIEANGYLVLAEDLDKFSSQFEYSSLHKHLHPQTSTNFISWQNNSAPNVIGPLAFGFSNTGELLRLYNYNDSLHVAMTFSKLPPWPLSPAGGGFTLESVANNLDLDNGDNWFAGCLGGSPGIGYAPAVASILADSVASICSGDTLLLAALTEANFDYQWFRNGVAIPDAIANQLAVSDSGDYSLTVKRLGCEASSTVVKVTIRQSPLAHINAAQNSYYCEGSSIVLQADSLGGQNFEWIKNDTIFLPLNQAMLQVADSGRYRVSVTQNACTRVSSEISISMQTTPLANLQQDSLYEICSGSNQPLYAPQGLGYSFHWFNNDTLIAGADSAIYAASQNGSYTFESIKNGCSNFSDPIEIIVNSSPFTFLSNLDTVVLCSGEQYMLQAYTDTSYLYQWFKNDSLLSGADSSSLAVFEPGSYKIITQNANCTSSAVKIVLVKPSPIAQINADSVVEICSGIAYQLKVDASLGYTYQWMKDSIFINGANASKYDVVDSGNYSVWVYLNSCVSHSNTIRVKVRTLPVNTILAADTTEFCEGNSVNLFAHYTSGLNYQWYRNGSSIVSQNDTTLQVMQSGNYYLVQNDNLCANSSNVLEIIVNPLPLADITANAATHLCKGTSVVLSTPLAADYSYQWFKNDLPIVGSDSSFLLVSDSGYYAVEVANLYCSKVTDSILVTQNPDLSVVVLAADTNFVCTGSPFLFEANTQQNLNFQWYFDTVVIPFADDSVYAAMTPGTYQVQVSDSNCSAFSSEKSLFQYTPTAVSISSFEAVCSNDSAFELSGGLPQGGVYSGNGIDTGFFTPSAAGSGFNTVLYSYLDTNQCVYTSSNVIEVMAQVPTPVITQNFNLLQSSSTNGNQWYLNDTLLPGATAQSYSPLLNGIYSVIVSDSSLCSSLPFYFPYLSLQREDYTPDSFYSLYPNPSQGKITLTFAKSSKVNAQIVVVDILGQLVYQQAVNIPMPSGINIDLQGVKPGIYLMRIHLGEKSFEEKLILH